RVRPCRRWTASCSGSACDRPAARRQPADLPHGRLPRVGCRPAWRARPMTAQTDDERADRIITEAAKHLDLPGRRAAARKAERAAAVRSCAAPLRQLAASLGPKWMQAWRSAADAPERMGEGR